MDNIYSDFAYDDAFRTMESECDDILISFTLEEIFRKHLYMLLPFYVFNLEKGLAEGRTIGVYVNRKFGQPH